MSDISELEQDIVAAALAIAVLPKSHAPINLKLLDIAVTRLLTAKAKSNGETVEQYIDRKQKLFLAQQFVNLNGTDD